MMVRTRAKVRHILGVMCGFEQRFWGIGKTPAFSPLQFFRINATAMFVSVRPGVLGDLGNHTS